MSSKGFNRGRPRVLRRRNRRAGGLVRMDRLNLDLSHATRVILTRLSQAPKWNSDLIRVGSSTRRFKVGIGGGNDAIELSQFRRSTDGNFVRKASLATIEARALRHDRKPVDDADPERGHGPKQTVDLHFRGPKPRQMNAPRLFSLNSRIATKTGGTSVASPHTYADPFSAVASRPQA